MDCQTVRPHEPNSTGADWLLAQPCCSGQFVAMYTLIFILCLGVICRTTARFFAVLDRQSISDGQHSLVRWHRRITSLFELHHSDPRTEVGSSLDCAAAAVNLAMSLLSACFFTLVASVDMTGIPCRMLQDLCI